MFDGDVSETVEYLEYLSVSDRIVNRAIREMWMIRSLELGEKDQYIFVEVLFSNGRIIKQKYVWKCGYDSGTQKNCAWSSRAQLQVYDWKEKWLLDLVEIAVFK